MRRLVLGALAVCGKDLRALVRSPSALVSAIASLVGVGVPVLFANQPRFSDYWAAIPAAMTVIAPALTMGVWADERKAGTESFLLAAPIPELSLSLGKFLAVYAVYLSSIALTLVIPLSFSALVPVEPGVLVSTLFGLALFGAAALALGQLISGFARGGLVPFLATAAIVAMLVSAHLVPRAVSLPAPLESALVSVSFAWRFASFARGVVDVADVAFFALSAAAMVLLDAARLSSRRWA